MAIPHGFCHDDLSGSFPNLAIYTTILAMKSLRFAAMMCAAFSSCLFYILPAMAAPPAFDCQKKTAIAPEKAEALLGQVQNTYAKLKTLQGQFLQESYLAALDISEQSTGNVWFSKPGLMNWHYLQPEEQKFIVHDNTLWLYQIQLNQVIIDSFSSILITDLPVAFLMGIGDLRRDFRVQSACKSEDKAGDGLVMNLLPQDAAKISPRQESDKGLRSFSLLVREKDLIPVGAKVTDIGGNVTSILLRGLTIDAAISESTYATNAFPAGVDIDDRRAGRKVIESEVTE